MIFTAIGITLLLILVFLLVVWILWFTFLWLSKLWYETSSTNFNRTSVRDLIHNSFAVPVYLLCVFYSRITNRISKMSMHIKLHIGLILLSVVCLGTGMTLGFRKGFHKGYNDCYEIWATTPQEYYGVYTIDSTTIITQLGLDKEQALEFHKEEVSTLKRELRDTTKLTYKFW